MVTALSVSFTYLMIGPSISFTYLAITVSTIFPNRFPWLSVTLSYLSVSFTYLINGPSVTLTYLITTLSTMFTDLFTGQSVTHTHTWQVCWVSLSFASFSVGRSRHWHESGHHGVVTMRPATASSLEFTKMTMTVRPVCEILYYFGR